MYCWVLAKYGICRRTRWKFLKCSWWASNHHLACLWIMQKIFIFLTSAMLVQFSLSPLYVEDIFLIVLCSSQLPLLLRIIEQSPIVLTTLEPSYLSEHIHVHTPSHHLWFGGSKCVNEDQVKSCSAAGLVLYAIAADNWKVTLLSLLDMSAAFDCVDHSILLHRLQGAVGVRSTARDWIRSFLSRRT